MGKLLVSGSIQSTNKLFVGSTSNDETSPGIGIHVWDIRDGAITPNSFGDQSINFYFDQEVDGDWKGIMHIKGWAGDYAAWQIAAQASNSATESNSLYFRTGIRSSWNSWHTLLDNKNYTSYTVTKTGSGASGTWGISITGNATTASTDTSSAWAQVYEVISTRNIASQSVNYATSAGNADTVDGWHADGFLQKHGWWSPNGSYSVDNLTSGIVFAYASHGAPAAWGHTIAFTSGGNNSYICQLHATGTNRLFMRNKSFDFGQKGWTELLTDSNYSWWCVPLSGGTMSGNLAISTYGNTMTIGSLNSGYCHLQSSADIPFYFNRRVFVDGCLGIYQMNSQGCGSSFPSSPTLGQIFFKI